MFSVRVLAFITAFLLPVFFSGDRLEKTVIAESGVPLSLVFKNECTVPLELYLTAEESQGEVKLLRVQNGQSVMLFSGTVLHSGLPRFISVRLPPKRA